MSRIGILTLLATATFTTTLSAQTLIQDPIAYCPIVSTSAKIDGSLEEVFWQIPPTVQNFVNLGGAKPKENTQAWVVFGKDGIYVAFECYQNAISQSNSPVSKQIWENDSVELFLDSDGDRRTYDHFILSVAGAKFQQRVKSIEELHKTTQLPWEGAAKVYENKWTAEIFIPYSTIGAKLKEGTVLRANLCRNNASTKENSSWVALLSHFHQPEYFGNLVMGVPSEKVTLNAITKQRLEVGEIKFHISAHNSSKFPVQILVTIYPGGIDVLQGKVLKLAPGKNLSADLPTKLNDIGPINLRLAAVKLPNKELVSEASFSGNVMSTQQKAVGGVISTEPWGVVWYSSPTFKVMHNTKPPSNKIQAIRISAARNEFESFQIVIKPSKELKNIKVIPHSFTGPKGAKIEAWNISVRQVEYVNIKDPSSPDVPSGAYPDPLPEMTTMNARPGVNNPIWLTLYVPSDTVPGEYSGTIDITAEGLKKIVVPVRLRVWDFELPKVSTLRTSYGCWLDGPFKYHGAKTLEQKRRIVELYNLEFWRHRIAPTVPYSCYDINAKLENGKVTIDFTDFDIAIQKFFPLFNSFNLPHFGMNDTAGMEFGDNYERLKIDYMRQVTEHLVEKGQIAKGYTYIFDEPTEEQYDMVRKAAELCRMADQRIKVLLTEQVEDELIGYVDIWVPLLSAYDEEKCKARQKAGEEVWWYVCCAPHHPYPNNFIDYPAIDQRILTWITWRYGVNGILYWSATYWRDNPWETAMSYSPDGKTKFGNGDGNLLYPPVRKPSDEFVDKGPIPSIRWEMIREGMEDYEYFHILQQRLKKYEGSSSPAVAKAKEALKLVEACAKSRTEYCKDPAQLESVRIKVAEAIEGLK
jgi:hypothetical protein